MGWGGRQLHLHYFNIHIDRQVKIVTQNVKVQQYINIFGQP